MDEFNLSARSHFDFSGLGELKARAQNKDKKVAKEVGSQFEALFVQMMLKSMREAAAPLKSGLLDSSASNTFEEMYHGELSQEIAKRSSLGIGDWILKSMRKNPMNDEQDTIQTPQRSSKKYEEIGLSELKDEQKLRL